MNTQFKRLSLFGMVGAAVTAVAAPNLNLVAQAVETVKLDGSSTVFPISEAVAEEFQKATKGKTRVTVGVSGTGGGFKKFCAGEINISGASRPIKDKEIELCKGKGIEFVELAVAFDALTVVVNKNNNWASSMTVEDLKKIWHPDNQATIKKWSDVKPGWPNQKINLYGPGTDSGTFDYFTKKVNGKTQLSRTDFTASEDDNILVQGVVRDKFALAYFGFAYFKENQNTLKAVSINGVSPSQDSVENGTYKPLSRPIFIYVNKKDLKSNKAVKAFTKFYLDNAATLSAEVGYVPLSSKVAGRSLDNFNNQKAGRTFSAKK